MSEEKDKSPAFQWYPRYILSSQRVALMTLQEEGAYRRALDFCWLHGSVPNDELQLSLVIGKRCNRKIASVVMKMFIQKNGDPTQLVSERLEIIRLQQEKNREIASRKGSLGAEKRWQGHGSGINQPMAGDGSSSSSSNSIINNTIISIDKKNEKIIPEKKILNVPFEEFWMLYDKKVGEKGKVEKKWAALKDEERTMAMGHIIAYKIAQPDKQFRKDPSTYLNNKSFNDEIISKNGNKQTQQSTGAASAKQSSISNLSDRLGEKLERMDTGSGNGL